MSFLSALGIRPGPTATAIEAAAAPAHRQQRQPAAQFASLGHMLDADRGYTANVTADSVWQFPALSNGLSLLMGLATQCQLKAEDENAPDEVHQFLATLDPDVAPGWTLAKTVEDLAIQSEAVWLVMEEYASRSTVPRYIRRADPRLCVMDPETGVIEVSETQDRALWNPRNGSNYYAPGEYVRFEGIVPGLLERGAEAIATALANLRQTRTFATNPTPSVIWQDAPNVTQKMSAADATKALTDAKEIVRKGGQVYVAGMVATIVGWSARELQLVDARDADALDAARLLSVHPRWTAAKSQGGDLTYANVQEIRRDLFEVGGLSMFVPPIEQRLSLSSPDRAFARRAVTPQGTRVKFSSELLFEQLAAPTPESETPSV